MRSETRRNPATRPTNTSAYFRNKPPRRAPELLPRFPSLSGVVQAIRRLRALVNRVTAPSAEPHAAQAQERLASGLPLLQHRGCLVDPLGFAKGVAYFQLGQQLRTGHPVHFIPPAICSTAAAYGGAGSIEMPPITSRLCRLTLVP